MIFIQGPNFSFISSTPCLCSTTCLSLLDMLGPFFYLPSSSLLITFFFSLILCFGSQMMDSGRRDPPGLWRGGWGVGVGGLHSWVTCRKLPFLKLISTWLFMITIVIVITYMRNTFGKSVSCSSLLWQSSSFPSFLFQEASSTCFPPSPSLLIFPPFLHPSCLE